MSDVIRMFRRSSAAVLGLALVAALALGALLAPLLTAHDPNEVDTTRRLARPLTPGHPLHPDTWGVILPEQGFHDVRVHDAGDTAYVVEATRAEA